MSCVALCSVESDSPEARDRPSVQKTLPVIQAPARLDRVGGVAQRVMSRGPPSAVMVKHQLEDKAETHSRQTRHDHSRAKVEVWRPTTLDAKTTLLIHPGPRSQVPCPCWASLLGTRIQSVGVEKLSSSEPSHPFLKQPQPSLQSEEVIFSAVGLQSTSSLVASHLHR
jgi:hypothetical protein